MYPKLVMRLARGFVQRARAGIFPLAGGLSLLWWLARVIPKPSRAQYPCMKAAFPAAAAFVVWLTGVWGAWFCLRKVGRSLNQGRYWRAGLCVLAGAVACALWAVSPFSLTPAAKAFVPSEGANQPMGVGKGIYPGRVVWVRDPEATPWDGSYGHWWDDNAIDQGKVENMFSISLRRLTGAGTDAEAWDFIFKFYNQSHDRVPQGYQPEEKIAIKINCNNAYGGYGDADDNIDASSQTVLALLRQLVNQAGVPQTNITIYEAMRVIPDRIYNKCHGEFPEVLWVDSGGDGVNGRQPVAWESNLLRYSNGYSGPGEPLPGCVVQATYLINMALLKGHSIAGVSLTAKNHFGSINDPTMLHNLIYASSPMGSYSPFVDLTGSPYLGDKTVLYLVDGLYGVHSVTDTLPNFGRWNNLFGGQWSSSLFASFDPVAIDSVALDFLSSEFGETLGEGNSLNADNYLHEEALADNPPSGTGYQTNGVRLASLGAHEHWNNAVEKKYSRNLGLSNGIELVSVQPVNTSTVLVPAGDHWKFRTGRSNPDPTWFGTNFNDSAWASGPAELGYGNSPATELPFGSDPTNKYITTYFRKQFRVQDPGVFTNLTLGLKRDDGAVVYLNGQEVWRENMPEGLIDCSTFASGDVNGSDETIFFQTSLSNALLTGVNLLAVEIHQSNASSEDLSFDLILTGNSAGTAIALKAHATGGSIVLSWPDTPYDYLLQSGSPWAADDWFPVSRQCYVFSNGQVRAVIEPVASNQWFRLKRGN